MRIPVYQVDAFASSAFKGNPAAVCPLEEWLPDDTMQAIAGENNLAETAFFIAENGTFTLRWFTPEVEVDLCGHATLASAFVLFQKIGFPGETVQFETKSGRLAVSRDGDKLTLDFPARPPLRSSADPGLVRALGANPREILAARDYLCVFDSEEQIRELKPDMAMLAGVDRFAVIATATGTDCDFVSRFFAPAQGIPEDPVTGSAHCTLIPYWSKRLGKKDMFARQISKRGGEIWCADRGERVLISGNAVLVMEGYILL